MHDRSEGLYSSETGQSLQEGYQRDAAMQGDVKSFGEQQL
jgi:hypothetical protein